jgi:hypothetical protein
VHEPEETLCILIYVSLEHQNVDFYVHTSARRDVPSINTPLLHPLDNVCSIENLIYEILLKTAQGPYPFVLVSFFGLMRRLHWCPLVCALQLPVRLHRIVWISPGL